MLDNSRYRGIFLSFVFAVMDSLNLWNKCIVKYEQCSLNTNILTSLTNIFHRDSMSLRRGGQYQYPALDTKYEEGKYNNDPQYLVDDSKFALDTEDSKSFDHLMPSSG